MSGLTREQLLAKIEERKRDVESFPVPEWDGDVYLRRLTLGTLQDTGYWDGKVDTNGIVINMLLAVLADEEGNQLLTKDDAKALIDAEVEVAMRLFGAAAKKHGLSNSRLEEAVAAFGEAQDGATSTE